MEGNKVIIIRASPETRTICPPEFIEGLWKIVPKDTKTIEITTPPGARELKVVDSGKWERNDSGETAPLFEVRFK